MAGRPDTSAPESSIRAVGVDAGGSKIAAGLVDPSGHVSGRIQVPTPPGPAEAVAALVHVVRAVAEGPGVGNVAGVGLGLPGLVTRGTGRFVYGPNFPLHDEDMGARIAESVGLGVVADNEGNAAALGEHRLGAGRGHDDLVYVAFGTGIAGGVVAGGNLLRGSHGWMGEFGHTVVDRDGTFCTCGQRGCWETIASGRALEQLARDLLGATTPPPSPGWALLSDVERGDVRAVEALDTFARGVATGLQNLVQTFDPELVVVGGGLAAWGDTLLDPVRACLDTCLSGRSHRTPPPIVAAHFGIDAALVGAGVMALDAYG
ncbi:MAG: ROK family protein [Acidimicrobiia bacterium]|nr:ROK family protein [Acidimicrobiia bacterium]